MVLPPSRSGTRPVALPRPSLDIWDVPVASSQSLRRSSWLPVLPGTPVPLSGTSLSFAEPGLRSHASHNTEDATEDVQRCRGRRAALSRKTGSDVAEDGQRCRGRRAATSRKTGSDIEEDGQRHRGRRAATSRKTGSDIAEDGQRHRGRRAATLRKTGSDIAEDGQRHRGRRAATSRKTCCHIAEHSQRHRARQTGGDIAEDTWPATSRHTTNRR